VAPFSGLGRVAKDGALPRVNWSIANEHGTAPQSNRSLADDLPIIDAAILAITREEVLVVVPEAKANQEADVKRLGRNNCFDLILKRRFSDFKRHGVFRVRTSDRTASPNIQGLENNTHLTGYHETT